MTKVKFVAWAILAIVAAGCVATEERSGPGADGVPQVDTLVVDDSATGGGLPTAPSPDQGDVPLSSGFVVGDGLTIADAAAYEGGEIIAVHGYLVITSQEARLCETLAESHPPQCGGFNLAITNPQAAATNVILIEDGDTQWSPEVVVLLGHVAGSDFTIDTTVTG
jgi:hypothetical protein